MSRLLYVEDDQTQARAMVRWLGARGFEVTHQCSAAAAEAALDAGAAFDAIVTDWNLGDGTSANVVTLAKLRRIPCCVYSGSCPLIGAIAKPDLDALKGWLEGVRA